MVVEYDSTRSKRLYFFKCLSSEHDVHAPTACIRLPVNFRVSMMTIALRRRRRSPYEWR